VHERVVAAGREFALAHFGLYAMESPRLEKCYRSWKADLTTEYTPCMASLERFVPLLVDATDADAAAVSIVYRGAQAVGLVTSGGYGYRLNRSIALAYVRTDLTAPGTELEVEILGERCRAVVAREPLYDPDNLRLRA
jgi:dimethylglycine dehydrogenase